MKKTRKPTKLPVKKKPDQGMLRAFLASFTIHAILIAVMAGGFSLSLPGCDPKSEEQAQAEKEGGEEQETAEAEKPQEPIQVEIVENILPKPAEQSESIEPPKELDMDGLFAEMHNAQDCPDFFGGIGITQKYVVNEDYTQSWYIVEEVHPGYPADRGGIMAGDRIETNTREIRGEIGTPITVMIIRGGELLTFNLIREKICISKEQNDQLKKMDEFDRKWDELKKGK